jgi:hypothetical protein
MQRRCALSIPGTRFEAGEGERRKLEGAHTLISLLDLGVGHFAGWGPTELGGRNDVIRHRIGLKGRQSPDARSIGAREAGDDAPDGRCDARAVVWCVGGEGAR